MIYPRQRLLAVRLLDAYTELICRTDFAGLRFQAETPPPPDRSLLLMANHSTWWDGFWAWQLNRKLKGWHRRFHALMLEAQLRRLWFFHYVGCFSIRPGHRSALESMQVAARLLQSPENMLLYFPQGKIESQHLGVPSFQKGVEKLLSKVPACCPVFGVFLIDYGSRRRPTVNIYLKPAPDTKPQEVAEAYQAFYRACKQAQLQQDDVPW
jgi:hypothetical protein